MLTPLITEIQRFCLQDGPGIRTTIFVKGCPLQCPWCHNPENISLKPEFYFHANKCKGCGQCVGSCPSGVCTSFVPQKGVEEIVDRSRCTSCLGCVSACRFGARETVGKPLDMNAIVEEAVSDRIFYNNSGGGVTISGGEPLMYPAFTRELTRILKVREDVHVAVETCLFAEWENIVPLLEFVDLFIVDIKSLEPEKYEQVIGGSLHKILANLERLIKAGAATRIHLPIIPGINDTAGDFEMYAEYLGQFADYLTGVDLLPYHSYATGKYAQLGRRYHYLGVPDLAARNLFPLADALRIKGIREVTIGGLVGTISPTGTAVGNEASRADGSILPRRPHPSRAKGVVPVRQ
ncbi:(R)-benzylsuccinate synthase, delta subunit [Geotalea daltonii FRC-32]|uniref:(R)-benzylsuccinate synthase, delta subunit n=1 Tax=Geotalea daltonii (strain DSM 22248 / JCM 15807 / FRC-32) TaxID=316067 RepID=B9M013_GEODF|nr:glycyl-radical enzyme activating protein [Geotalea daltonii]ACM20793.1 (R)-benzylsuccinate synthase, delta subunit [Geotalea daltonii FRC-32]